MESLPPAEVDGSSSLQVSGAMILQDSGRDERIARHRNPDGSVMQVPMIYPGRL
ncbi:MAG TPA: hypothetical protein VKB21_05835 [Candidatus Acidoferrum sp.]|nr:hypothetical protein [Candidatus Acidoferrum sp.]